MSKQSPTKEKSCKVSSSKPFTPRGYLSWSQLNMWEKDPNLYYQVYWEGLDQFRSKFLELGKRMADGLENGFDCERDPMFEHLIMYLPSYPKKEFDLKADYAGIPLVGKLDGWNEATMTIGEYKTGKKWTQSMANQHGQLKFYALLVWLKYHKLPEHIFLHWAETAEDLEGNLKLTGGGDTFEVKIKLSDIIVFAEKRIKPAWEGICKMGEFVKDEKQHNVQR